VVRRQLSLEGRLFVVARADRLLLVVEVGLVVEALGVVVYQSLLLTLALGGPEVGLPEAEQHADILGRFASIGLFILLHQVEDVPWVLFGGALAEQLDGPCSFRPFIVFKDRLADFRRGDC